MLNYDFIKQLVALGMKENEAQVYVACFEEPYGLFVHQIVERTALRRSTIDLILQRLQQQAFISRSKEGARWIYSAEDPQRVAYSFQNRVKDLSRAAYEMKEKLNHRSALPRTRYYEGTQGIKAIYDDMLMTLKSALSKRNMNESKDNRYLKMLKEGASSGAGDKGTALLKGEGIAFQDSDLCTISSGRDLLETLPDHGVEFVRKRVNAGVPIFVIAPDNALSRRVFQDHPGQLRRARFFDPSAYHVTTETNIYGDKVAHIQFDHDRSVGSMIQNKAIADSLRAQFAMQWDGLA